ncbi:CvpA family protein [Microbacterium hominis]|uniref:CvpA family protein n=1 Tax=Microbacterium hominis TaxID=162426 RepID=UPI000B2AA22C
MLIVDIIAAAALLIAFAAGIARGFFASLGSVIGMIVGVAAALWLLPLATPWLSTVIPSGGARTAALAAAAIGLVVIGRSAGAGSAGRCAGASTAAGSAGSSASSGAC